MSSYTTSGELSIILADEIAGLTATQYQRAIDSAMVDCGWGFPPGTDFKEAWLRQRAERYCINQKVLTSADKFKVKQYSLEQKFDHWYKLILKMDADFEKAIEENPAVFSNVEAVQMFGHVASAGFSYDQMGRDTTYTTENEIIITPEDDA